MSAESIESSTAEISVGKVALAFEGLSTARHASARLEDAASESSGYDSPYIHPPGSACRSI